MHLIRNGLKALLVTVASLLFVVMALAIVVPRTYKNEIQVLIETEIEKMLEADVYFDIDDVTISVFSNFPQLTLEMHNFGLIGVNEFKSDTLLHSDALRLEMNLWSVIFADAIEVNKIGLDGPKVNIFTLKSGQANYDVYSSSGSTKDGDTSASPMALNIESWEIAAGRLRYRDEGLGVDVLMDTLNMEGSATMLGDLVKIESNLLSNAFSMSYERIKYFNAYLLKASLSIDFDMEKFAFTLNDGTSVTLNEFPLLVNGTLELPDNGDILTNIHFEASNTEFKSLLSVVPTMYDESFSKLKSEGQVSFAGEVNGAYNENTLPVMGLSLNVSNGIFKYDGLPESVNGVNIDLRVDYKDSSDIRLDMPRFEVKLSDNPISANLSLKKQLKLAIQSNLKVKFNLLDIQKIFPIEELDFAGNLGVEASVDGMLDMEKKVLPSIRFETILVNGRLASEKVPFPVKDIFLSLSFNLPNGEFEKFDANLSRFNFNFGEEQFNVFARLKNLGDPSFELDASGGLNLDQFNKLIPEKAETIIGGQIGLKNLKAAGKLSSIASAKYQDIETGGQLTASNLVLKTKSLPLDVNLTNVELGVSPERLTMDNFKGSIGNTDFSVNGVVENYLGYFLALSDSVLKGNFVVKSSNLDVDQLMTLVPESSAQPTQNEESPTISLPANLNLVLNTSIGQVVYSSLNLSNFEGKVFLKNGKATLENLSLLTLDGNIQMDGSVDLREGRQPFYDLRLNATAIDISKTLHTFVPLQGFVPIAEKVKGKVSGAFEVSGGLGEGLSLDYNSINAEASVWVLVARIENVELIKLISRIGKQALSDDLEIRDVRMKGKVVSGRLIFDPFTLPIGKSSFTLGGTSSLDGELQCDANLNFPVNNIEQSLFFKINGSYDDLQVSLVNGQGLTVKEQVKSTVETAKADIKEEATEQLEEKKAELKEKAEEKKEEAKDNIKNALREKLKKKGG
ncbi:MAG: AsmA-like C-terminal region-containing protein [Imperialibacter sp.]|uniref:AsmA-like C-terminal region-containing protein n=1 Tax=Imperialibacter sp. TaxID=2038411 RepID=UPI0032EBC820